MAWRNAVVIMTSNIPGEPSDFFRPEFINRIDEIVRFRTLTQDDMGRIVEIQFASLIKRLADRRIELHVSDAAMHKLGVDGYDPVFGARPLKRLIQKRVGDNLALALLEGKFTDGDTVTVDVDSAGELIMG